MQKCDPSSTLMEHGAIVDTIPRVSVLLVDDTPLELLALERALCKRLHPHDDYGGGTGVGLTIAKKTSERHGGTLRAESIYGKGSTFYFTLPGSVTGYGGDQRS